MKFDAKTTVGIFVVIVAVGVLGLLAMGVMETGTVLMMVLPALVVFGLLFLFLGVKHGEYRAVR
ncbi:hypothetical protein ACFQPA_08650 [Halomarina halobia]|uniref:Uncharacterized protein n=1 Tax=Halomarina halobia TaxID=3033386 RepID=A0ABD6ABQ1_9EURY|nr:hypothetical protein [Halomarina sp. PSR21]